MGVAMSSGGVRLGGEQAQRTDGTRELGRTGERVSCIGMGGFHLGLPKVSEAAKHSTDSRRHRWRHYVHGQQLGLQRWPERNANGESSEGWPPPESVSHD